MSQEKPPCGSDGRAMETHCPSHILKSKPGGRPDGGVQAPRMEGGWLGRVRSA